MLPETLEPKADLLCEEYVLVQAWKKTVAYIRSHNWYADTLALDITAANLPDFLSELAEQLKSPDQWNNKPLRIVPAPKSQRWQVQPKTGLWEPVEKKKTDRARKLRPLAHVSLKDQVAATALMLCLADRVETMQGDPRISIKKPPERKTVVSYGNRLLCDNPTGFLRHRWGSTQLYRGFFQDYRRFLTRPDIVAEAIASTEHVVIVHSDLRQFYDRVRPALLADKINCLQQQTDDPKFFDMARRILRWEWHNKDNSELPDFSVVALPQGLVAAGFFANVVLLDFDQALREEISKEIMPNVLLHDVCRYVDDIRLVLSLQEKPKLNDIEESVVSWLQNLLNQRSDGQLIVSDEKTHAALFRGDERPLVRQSRKMERIQHAISGGFDAIGGEEILDAVQGLVRSQARYSKDKEGDKAWPLAPVPDVADDTVARFAAARFRSTFRSLRPLLVDHEVSAEEEDATVDRELFSSQRVARTRADLDDETRTFALGLIENWVSDPSNVRLLRIGLDLYPATDILERVFMILSQYTTKGGGRKAPRRVAWYCLAEIFRAGATETGFVDDTERLPEGVDIIDYRKTLGKEAVRLVSLPSSTLPWYLRQQVLLFLAANNPKSAPVLRPGRNPETKHYREVIRYLRGEVNVLGDRDFATIAILSRRSFLNAEQALKLANASITSNRLKMIMERDPSFGLELLDTNENIVKAVPSRIRQDLCLTPKEERKGWMSLAEFVLSNRDMLRSEPSLLDFTVKSLAVWPLDGSVDVITPCDILLRVYDSDPANPTITEINIIPNKLSPEGSLYKPPEWCPPEAKWRLQLGYLLRFILSAQHDFTKSVRPRNWREGNNIYRVPESHWYARRYGLYSGYSAYGADWLPITDWTEDLMYALLSWPGCRPSKFFKWVELGIAETRRQVEKRIQYLSDKRGRMSNMQMLPLSSKWPEKPTTNRPLRICVVQTVIPTPEQIDTASHTNDLTMSGTAIRREHRNHLSAALSAVERMLDLRETHKERGGRLDLLVLPELSVHPLDIDTHLVPFARSHKSIVLAGLSYEELFPKQPLINSALWLIPVWSNERGFQVVRRRQGKQHLAPEEKQINNPVQRLQGFRPCQWLVGYEWDKTGANRPLFLTASVCYDATDIRLTADLRDKSDIFAVPALNQDVNTFDQMALALHYHMFQMVIIANNGTHGGSNAYAPYREPYTRQIFHLHGQPQATISFLEIDNPEEFINRGMGVHLVPEHEERIWKYPAADWTGP
jgi:hypothetical protein